MERKLWSFMLYANAVFLALAVIASLCSRVVGNSTFTNQADDMGMESMVFMLWSWEMLRQCRTKAAQHPQEPAR